MHRDKNRSSWKILEELIVEGLKSNLEFFFETIPASERARALSRISEEERIQLMKILGPEDAADLIEDLPDAQAADMLEEIKPADAAAIVTEMDSDDRVDVLGDVEEKVTQAILNRMEPEEAEEARQMLTYSDDSAGGIMIKEYLSYSDTVTLQDIRDDLRKNKEKYAEYNVQYIYICTSENTISGILRMRDMVLNSGSVRAADIALKSPIHVHVNTSLSELQTYFDEHPYMGIPVTDDAGHLEGVILRGDVEEAAEERAREDLMKVSGIVDGEELRSMPLQERSARRLSWLSINLVLSLISVCIITFFEDTIKTVVALAFFLPMITNISGCSGNQAVAVSIRELALGFTNPRELFRVFVKEISVGLINGIVLGVLISTLVIFWHGNIFLGLVIGIALFLNTIMAVILGGLLPLILQRMGRDPALASGPIVTTITDMCGFFVLLTMATRLLSRLSL